MLRMKLKIIQQLKNKFKIKFNLNFKVNSKNKFELAKN
jgi:hypothetical protein